jgi:L-fucose mutarotase
MSKGFLKGPNCKGNGMLKGVDPVLSGGLLKALDEMGHGDTLALVDRNYPSYSAGPPVVHLGDISVVRAAQAIFTVFPLDTFIETPLVRMRADEGPEATETHNLVLQEATRNHPQALPEALIPRPDFYERAGHCAVIVQCLETAPYSCFILRKGVV